MTIKFKSRDEAREWRQWCLKCGIDAVLRKGGILDACIRPEVEPVFREAFKRRPKDKLDRLMLLSKLRMV